MQRALQPRKLELGKTAGVSSPTLANKDIRMSAIMDIQPAHWTEGELQDLKADYPDVHGAYDTNPSKYNPRPGV